MISYYKRPRRKAFLGIASAVIGGVGTIANIVGGMKQRQAQQNQMYAQANAERRKQGIESASAYTQAYANSDELSREFRERFLRYGGRRKFNDGGEEEVKTSSPVNKQGVVDVINSLSTLATGINSAVASPVKKPIVNTIADSTIGRQVGTNNANYDNVSNANKNLFQTTTLYKFGGRRHTRKC